MAQVSFAPDRIAPALDGRLEEAAAQAALASRPIRVRIQPAFYNLDKSGYDGWNNLVWTLDLDDVEEGRRLRQGLEAFLKAFGDPERQAKVLRMLEKLA